MATSPTAYSARDIMMRAQTTLDMHTYGHDGQCLACGLYECPKRDEAVRMFYSRYGVLPQRRPGASQWELAQPARSVVAALPLVPPGSFGPGSVGTLKSRAVGRASVPDAAALGLRAVTCTDCRQDWWCHRCRNRGWIWSVD